MLKLIKKEKLPNSRVKFIASLPFDEVSKEYDKQLEEVRKNATFDGFRKGHAPKELVEKEYGRSYIMNLATKSLLEKYYPNFIVEQKVDALGAPEIKIGEISEGKDIEVEIEVSVLPEIKLPDYKKIAQNIFKEIKEQKVSKGELDDVLLHIRKQKLQSEQWEKQMKEGKEPKVKPISEIKDEEAPELDDKFVKTLGDFKSVKDFEKHIKENLKKEKEFKELEKQRIEFAEKLVEEANIDLPQVLIDAELERMLRQMEADLAQAGITLEAYLSKVKQTKQDLFKQWEEGAKKRAALQLLLNEIAKKEKLTPKKEDVQKEVDAIVSQYPQANREAAFDFVYTQKSNEAVFNFLQNGKKSTK